MAAEALSSRTIARPLFVATIVTGSFLLFLTQPMIARMALPRLGGAPAVWNSAMLVFQALLLVGYAYAHWLTRLAPRLQAGVHLVLFAAAALWLPIGLTGAELPAGANPAFWTPWFLLSSVGPLFFIVSAQAPLMQRWYALETGRGDPYPLYAASNLGSFAGLIAYPLAAEPLLGLGQQSFLWTCGYALLVLLVAGCALTVPRDLSDRRIESTTAAPPPRRVLHWIALAAVPSGLMLSTTTHLTTDIVAMPLLWVLPLGLYLLSFAVAFARWREPAVFIVQLAPLIVLIGGGFAFAQDVGTPLAAAALELSLLFVTATALHSALYEMRPPIDHLTGFYLAMAVGGMIGGLFCAILAPALFDWAYEHPLLIFAAALLLPQQSLFPPLRRLWANRTRRMILSIALPLLALPISLIADQRLWVYVPPGWAIAGSISISLMAVLSIGRRIPYTLCLAALMMSYGGWSTINFSMQHIRTRSYFGIYEVVTRDADTLRTLTHGTTLHGSQLLSAGEETLPTTYYGHRSGVGRALLAADRLYGAKARIGVVGLGAGTLACYREPGQSWRFFEIDPAMVQIAKGKFSFLARCAPQVPIRIGDARLSLSAEPSASLDLLAIDAFSSDAVPMHLLTREALRIYGRVLQPHGLLLVHISNRYLDLKPVLAADAAAEGWTAALVDYGPTPDERAHEQTISVWVAMSRDPASMAQLIVASGQDSYLWQPLKRRPGFAGWSDDHASILPLLTNLWGAPVQ